MSAITTYAGRHRVPTLLVLTALAAVIAVFVLVAAIAGSGDTAQEVQAPASNVQAPPYDPFEDESNTELEGGYLRPNEGLR